MSDGAGTTYSRLAAALTSTMAKTLITSPITANASTTTTPKKSAELNEGTSPDPSVLLGLLMMGAPMALDTVPLLGRTLRLVPPPFLADCLVLAALGLAWEFHAAAEVGGYKPPLGGAPPCACA